MRTRRADIPDAYTRIAAAGEKEVERRVERETVNAAQMPMVVTDDLVHFEVPAHDFLILTCNNRRGGEPRMRSSGVCIERLYSLAPSIER